MSGKMKMSIFKILHPASVYENDGRINLLDQLDRDEEPETTFSDSLIDVYDEPNTVDKKSITEIIDLR